MMSAGPLFIITSRRRAGCRKTSSKASTIKGTFTPHSLRSTPHAPELVSSIVTLNGEARGATIRNAVPGAGSSFSIGEKSGAWFTLGDSKTATQAILVEAPIDAISFAAIKQPDRTVILAMSCANVFRPVLAAAHERHWPLTVAFDNDSAGHTGWERCMENHHLLYPNDPPPNRATPRAKDWNEGPLCAPRRNHRRRL